MMSQRVPDGSSPAAAPARRLCVFLGALFAVLLSLSAPLAAQEAQEAEVSADAQSAEAENAEIAEEPSAETAPTPKRSPGMSLPFDGSSTEAFEESLSTIQSEVTDAEFTTLQNALDYLLVYDLGARRDKDLLYQRLDGKTPNEVLDMVKWRQEGTERVRGRN